MNSEIKIYQIKGKYVKYHQKFEFSKYCRAMSKENALEKILSTVTSSKILRRKIEITEVKTVPLEKCEDLYIRELAEME